RFDAAGDDARDSFWRLHLLVEQHLEPVEEPPQLAWLKEMIGRRRSETELALIHGERLVQHDSPRLHHLPDGRKEIALQITGDQHEVEESTGQLGLRQIRAPAAYEESVGARAVDGIVHRVELHVDA